MIPDLSSVECITLFVEDLASARSFYEGLFSVSRVYEDPSCAVVRMGNIMLNLLKNSEASTLIEPARVGDRYSGSRFMLTINVKNVDSVCYLLKQQGVRLLNGPIDRPWGRRTAAFSDPAGNAWEVAQEIVVPSTTTACSFGIGEDSP
jgi:lactoylglutathione lyase